MRTTTFFVFTVIIAVLLISTTTQSATDTLGQAPTDKKNDSTSKQLLAQSESHRRITNSIGMELVYIEPGSFLMGSPLNESGRRDGEGPQHRVTISQSFYLQITEVTRVQFSRFVSASGYKTDAEKKGYVSVWSVDGWKKVEGASWKNPGYLQSDDHPVVCVSWNDAIAFCEWLSQKDGIEYRLPTEAEWEYAGRAGTKTAYQWGNNPDDGRGWCNGADLTFKNKFSGWTTFNWSDGYVYTSPVAAFKANAFGLYDMHGNVWEWCADWYGEDYYKNSPSTDPQGPSSGEYRVLRGGSWCGLPWPCRSADRFGNKQDSQFFNVGFRIARVKE